RRSCDAVEGAASAAGVGRGVPAAAACDRARRREAEGRVRSGRPVEPRANERLDVMQTRFKPERLADPDVREAEQVLRKCVHCGFCTATCPTYVLLGDELDSPRGRIYLIKDMLENDRPATAEVVRHIDRCLSCLACMTTCPSGVHYQHLIDHARVHVERTYRRPWRERWKRDVLAAVLPYPKRFAAAMRLGMLARPVIARMPAGVSRLRNLLQERFDPRVRAPRSASPSAAERPSTGADRAGVRPTRRVALLEGCVESVLTPEIHAAAKRVLAAAGVDVVSVPGCCGSI